MDWSCESSDRGYVHLAQCCHSPEEHVCGWNCATEKIIGNMWICKVSLSPSLSLLNEQTHMTGFD